MKKHKANPKSRIEYKAIDFKNVRMTVFRMTMWVDTCKLGKVPAIVKNSVVANNIVMPRKIRWTSSSNRFLSLG